MKCIICGKELRGTHFGVVFASEGTLCADCHEAGTELHPAGTRDRIAALEAERDTLERAKQSWYKTATARTAERDRLLDALRDERQDRALAETRAAAAIATMKQQQAINALTDDKHIIGKLMALLEGGAGRWSDEYRKACELIVAVPEGGISVTDATAEPGGLSPLDTGKSPASNSEKTAAYLLLADALEEAGKLRDLLFAVAQHFESNPPHDNELAGLLDAVDVALHPYAEAAAHDSAEQTEND